MKYKGTFCFLIIFTIFPLLLTAQIAAPQVTNVLAEQLENSTSVRITYDLADSDTDSLFVIVEASADSGKTFIIPVTHVSGDVGFGVVPGAGKEIIWEAYNDDPEVTAEYFQMKVIAIDAPIGKLVSVPRDTFQMGTDTDRGQFGPEHSVIVSSFLMSATEITNVQYKQFCDATNRDYPDDPATGYFLNYPDYPVVNITWNDAQAFCNWLSQLQGFSICYDFATSTLDTSKTGYRLPSEAEWEFAARGDSVQKTYPWGTDILGINSCNYLAYSGDLVDKMPPFDNNRGPVPVAGFEPTGAGFYDLAGNVAEWCLDEYNPDFYLPSLQTNPLSMPTGSSRVIRGGDWVRTPDYLRVFDRDMKAPESLVNGYYRGFRILRRTR